MSKTITVDDYGKALSEFVALTAYRLATSPHSAVGEDELKAYQRVKATLYALLLQACGECGSVLPAAERPAAEETR